jgi:predicted RNase H-like HicB family nuclease
MVHYELPVKVRLDEDLVYVARCPVIPGCVSQGATLDEAIANLNDAIRACIDVMTEDQSPLLSVLKEFEVLEQSLKPTQAERDLLVTV